MRIGDLCEKISSIEKGASLKEVYSVMGRDGVDAAVVLDRDMPVGIVSSYDVLERIVEEADLEKILVDEVMNSTIISLDAGLTVEEAARIMLAHKHWMAVVVEKGKYKGIVTPRRLLKALVS